MQQVLMRVAPAPAADPLHPSCQQLLYRACLLLWVICLPGEQRLDSRASDPGKGGQAGSRRVCLALTTGANGTSGAGEHLACLHADMHTHIRAQLYQCAHLPEPQPLPSQTPRTAYLPPYLETAVLYGQIGTREANALRRAGHGMPPALRPPPWGLCVGGLTLAFQMPTS